MHDVAMSTRLIQKINQDFAKPVNQTTMIPVMTKPQVMTSGSSVMVMPVVQTPMTPNMTKPLVTTAVAVPVITNS
jgi:hypothetical protein